MLSERLALFSQTESQEGRLVSICISGLYENPIAGKFDIAHLKAIHAYIFQYTPRHKPGVIRGDTGFWSKQRALEGRPGRYEVVYLADGAEGRIKQVLIAFGGADALRGVSIKTAATKLARLYSDLDHAHGFYEGNSRALREFTRTLALEAGFRLDWTGSRVTADNRNALYMARDFEVMNRQYPRVTIENAENQREYESALQVESFRKTLGAHPLEDIIRSRLSIMLLDVDNQTASAIHSKSAVDTQLDQCC